jgi:hypothetical protein
VQTVYIHIIPQHYDATAACSVNTHHTIFEPHIHVTVQEEAPAAAPPAAAAPAAAVASGEPAKKKFRAVPLPVEGATASWTQQQVNTAVELEASMAHQDKVCTAVITTATDTHCLIANSLMPAVNSLIQHCNEMCSAVSCQSGMFCCHAMWQHLCQRADHYLITT